MTKLLVSVRNSTEARLAWQAGAHLIDVKEPSRGSLGAASHDILQQIAEIMPPEASLSAALGEMVDDMDGSVVGLPARFQFAKIGLAGCRMQRGWCGRWAKAFARLPGTTHRVAVAYADWEQAGSPAPVDVIRHGADIGCRVVLIDTFQKKHGSLLSHLDATQLVELHAVARELEMMFVVAGSLDLATIRELRYLAPDYFAVRGAVCRPDREGPLDIGLVQTLLNNLAPSQGQCRDDG